MRDLGSHTKDLVSAVLSYEFDGGEIDAWAIDLVRGESSRSGATP
ncbi:hypothetical protein BTZ20_4084 [Rhodococcus sp. MTM3W5.2]|nr:hypothetical protein [Rhodococcus sp. MTM3W5.2]AQA24333.1 hypothetical protein BTZ20_4084 [Rhodococcus sp. MTM3W5.2]